MEYYKTYENRQGKLAGAIGVVVYVLVCCLLMWLVNFHHEVTPTQGEGIMVNFGDTETGQGDLDLNATDTQGATASSSAADSDPQQITTQDNDPDAPAVRPTTPQAVTSVRPAEKPTPKPKPTPTPAQPVRTADPRASFPGRTPGSTATSEGVASGAGNQGNPAGSPDGAHDGTGSGNVGVSFSLSGRSNMGELHKPDYVSNVEGRVVMQIIVDSNGSVTSATYRAAGSTTQNNVLVASARKAALKTRFSAIQSDTPQTGTITYIYKFKQ